MLNEFVSDPARPVPYIDKIAIGMTRPYMVDDQRFASRRPDVAVFETDVLEEDLTLVGRHIDCPVWVVVDLTPSIGRHE